MLLSANNIWSGYGDITILCGAELQIDAAETVAVLGRNGVGKTTLVRALSGALPCKRGVIRFGDRDITTLPAHERAKAGIAYVPQGRQIFAQLTVMENILVGAYAARFDSARLTRLTDEVLTYFQTLKPKLKELGGSLSGGQQQLLALARALMTEPKILLLDEPSEGIQPSLLDDIADVLNKVSANTGLAVLLVEQNLDFARKLATRAYLMESGSIRRSINIDEFANDRDLERELFGAVAPEGA
jgi:urea ABC transporter ATP-binding protein UrtE